MRRFICKIFLILFILVIPFLFYFSFCIGDNSDLLNSTFSPSTEKHAVINVGNSSSSVGWSFLRQSKGYSWGTGFYSEAPIIVKIVKIILKITVVLSVTMVIFYGVKFMLQVFKGNDYKSAGAKKDLINLFIGLFVSLFSITAVTLVISIPKSSMTTGEDLSVFEVGCRIDGNVYIGNSFKEHLCKNTSLGYQDNPSSRKREYIKAWSNGSTHMDDRAIGAYRCKVIIDINNNDSRKRVRIKNASVETYCRDLGGQPTGG